MHSKTTGEVFLPGCYADGWPWRKEETLVPEDNLISLASIFPVIGTPRSVALDGLSEHPEHRAGSDDSKTWLISRAIDIGDLTETVEDSSANNQLRSKASQDSKTAAVRSITRRSRARTDNHASSKTNQMRLDSPGSTVSIVSLKHMSKGNSHTDLLDSVFFKQKVPQDQSNSTVIRQPTLDLGLVKTEYGRPLSLVMTPTHFYVAGESSEMDENHERSSTSELTTSLHALTREGSPPPAIEGYQVSRLHTEEPRLPGIAEVTVTGCDIQASALVATTPMRLRNGSVVAVITPEGDPWRRHVYHHGPMRFDPPGPYPRRGAAYENLMDWQENDTTAQLEADEKVLIDLVEYFVPLANLPEPEVFPEEGTPEDKLRWSAPILDSELVRRIADMSFVKAQTTFPHLVRAPSAPLPARSTRLSTFRAPRASTSTTSSLARKLFKRSLL